MTGSPGSAAGKAPSLTVSGLRAEVAGREVIHGIDLVVRPGEVHVVMGPNGSGKSTLAHALMGRPGTVVTAGSIQLNGTELVGLESWQRARAGLFLALQQPIEVPGVGLEAVLAEALADVPPDAASVRSAGGKGRAAPVVADGRHDVGRSAGLDAELPDLTHRIAAEAAAIRFDPRLLHRALNVDLSGGERKRNEIVQLGVIRPAYCVLDEIDSGLDVDALGTISRRLEAATGEWGLGVLAVTHFQRLLVELRADRVHVLVDGRIEASGGPELALELERTGYAAYGGTAR